ncbi:hypothetical protein D0T84_08700 [Dysgonomonas sp. 521]|nr:hypothetical protein [Dysgonomonas sp. 521]
MPGDKEINMPCSGAEFRSDKEFIRATRFELSTDMSVAKTKALTTARADLASEISTAVGRTTDNYASSYQSGESEEAKTKMNDMVRNVAKENITNSRIICEKVMQTADGKYRCYITLEISANEALNGLKNKMMDDEKLRTDFEYEKYKKVFEDEMSKIN